MTSDVGIPIDAWKQEADLHKRFTKQVNVRTDLSVVARAHERVVEFGLAEDFDDDGRQVWHSTIRNVPTMRELAQAINEACDFVEAFNPTWAKGLYA